MPIVALTTHALAGEADIVLDAGMDDYLTKPLQVLLLLRQVLSRLLPKVSQAAAAPTGDPPTA